MSSATAPRLASATGHIPGGSRLHAALLHFPRSRFPAEHPSLEAELTEPPEALVVVSMLDALELKGGERVLDVGSQSSYAAALLSQLAAEVYSLVDTAELAEQRERELTELGCGNVRLAQGEAVAGWQPGAPYQAILVGSGAQQLPVPLLDQLEVGGRLVIPIGDKHAQLLERLRKRHGAVESETLCACHLRMLEGRRGPPSSFPWTRG